MSVSSRIKSAGAAGSSTARSEFNRMKSVTMKLETNEEVFKLIVPGLRCEVRGQASQKGKIVKVMPNNSNIKNGTCKVHWDRANVASEEIYNFSLLCILFKEIDYIAAEEKDKENKAAAVVEDDDDSSYEMVKVLYMTVNHFSVLDSKGLKLKIIGEIKKTD